jgi:hypothetical protein
MDRTEKKSWFRFIDQASDEELHRAETSLTAELELATHPDVRWSINWHLRRLREELAARAEVARLRKLYSAR